MGKENWKLNIKIKKFSSFLSPFVIMNARKFGMCPKKSFELAKGILYSISRTLDVSNIFVGPLTVRDIESWPYEKEKQNVVS